MYFQSLTTSLEIVISHICTSHQYRQKSSSERYKTNTNRINVRAPDLAREPGPHAGRSLDPDPGRAVAPAPVGGDGRKEKQDETTPVTPCGKSDSFATHGDILSNERRVVFGLVFVVWIDVESICDR
jgi:hypothetical protein